MPPINTRNPVSSANFMGHPLHPILITLPIGLFIGTFLCDFVYWWTNNAAFATAGIWILGAGLVGAALAAVAGLIDFLGDGRIRAISDAWQHAIGNVILVLIQLFSFSLSLWSKRGRAGGARAVARCGGHHGIYRLEGRRAGLPASRRRL